MTAMLVKVYQLIPILGYATIRRREAAKKILAEVDFQHYHPQVEKIAAELTYQLVRERENYPGFKVEEWIKNCNDEAHIESACLGGLNLGSMRKAISALREKFSGG